MTTKSIDYGGDFAVRSGVIVAEVPHEKGGVEVIEEEAGQHGILSLWWDRKLRCPIRVVPSDPTEIVPSKRDDGAPQM
jgi:hypothetical protein